MKRNNGKFVIGKALSGDEKEVTNELVEIKSADLTTHGVIVGMTGSGKTGLGIVTLEEAILAKVPVLAIDPKGDLTNLCLAFPDLEAKDFEPWLDQTGLDTSPQEASAKIADTWSEGLKSWDTTESEIRTLKDADPTIYTPGSDIGVSLDVLGRLSAPSIEDATAKQNEVENTVTALLGLIGVESDPLAGKEHILLSNLIAHSWDKGKDLDMPTLLAQIQDPPMRKLGVLEMDKFFPAKERQKLVLKLNGLLASPSFAAWAKGAPLDIQKMLWDDSGNPQVAIVSVSHLEEKERHFAVSLILSKVISWMRTQQGTGELRALIYIDEVMGYAPPNANPSPKKPILTILKQARAFGIGLMLSTQNPVDLDYKALSNAGTWLIGRLQTEQDKNRLIDGLKSADGSTNIKQLEATIGNLDKREFVYRSSKSDDIPLLTTRWAMSYLAGPLSGSQISQLMADKKKEYDTAVSSLATGEADTSEESSNDDTVTVAPEMPESYQNFFVSGSAPWLEQVEADISSKSFKPSLAIRIEMLFDDTASDVRETQEWESILLAQDNGFDPDKAIAVDFDDRDFVDSPTDGAEIQLPEVEITDKLIKKTITDLKNHLYTNLTITIYKNAKLKLWSRPGEPKDDFQNRCNEAAEIKADEQAAKLRDKLETKSDRINAALAKAEDRVAELQAREDSDKSHKMMDVGSSILGGLLGGRSKTRGLASAARKMSSANRRSSNRKAQLETALNRVEEKVDQLEDLEAELQEAVIDIDDEWSEVAEQIEEKEITLEKSDIVVKDTYIVWLPM